MYSAGLDYFESYNELQAYSTLATLCQSSKTTANKLPLINALITTNPFVPESNVVLQFKLWCCKVTAVHCIGLTILTVVNPQIIGTLHQIY